MSESNNGAKPMKSAEEWVLELAHRIKTCAKMDIRWFGSEGVDTMGLAEEAARQVILMVQADALASVATHPSSDDEKLVCSYLQAQYENVPSAVRRNTAKETIDAFNRLMSSRSTHNAELVECLNAFIEQEIEYMTINNLGNPEKQHNVIRARAVLAKLPPPPEKA